MTEDETSLMKERYKHKLDVLRTRLLALLPEDDKWQPSVFNGDCMPRNHPTRRAWKALDEIPKILAATRASIARLEATMARVQPDGDIYKALAKRLQQRHASCEMPWQRLDDLLRYYEENDLLLPGWAPFQGKDIWPPRSKYKSPTHPRPTDRDFGLPSLD